MMPATRSHARLNRAHLQLRGITAFHITILGVLILALGAGIPQARAEGEPVGTFPNWAERTLHALVNRARAEPAEALGTCSGNPSGCPDAGCYPAVAPLSWKLELARAARFHSDEMTLQGYTGSNSCLLVANISSLYPASCNGAASCACEGGVNECPSTCTFFTDRIALFGATASAENIYFGTDPNDAVNGWLTVPTSNPTCNFTLENGYRQNILKSNGAFGAGVSGRTTADFGAGTAPAKVPSGSHYPRQAASVDFWMNWYDNSGPLFAAVNVEGVCTNLTLSRGNSTNGAWTANVSGVGSGCHRYYFQLVDSNGLAFNYPTTGSFGIGPEGSCPDWQAARPANCAPLVFEDGFESP
jgi:hypothetical protein